MTATIILNPYANRWNSRKRWPQAEAALRAAGAEFDLVTTSRAGEAAEFAEAAAKAGRFPVGRSSMALRGPRGRGPGAHLASCPSAPPMTWPMRSRSLPIWRGPRG